MSTGETPNEESEAETRRAQDFCEDIRHAVELQDQSVRLEHIAQRTASKVMMGSMFDALPFRFQVDIPQGTEAYVTIDDEVIQQQPTSFLATEITSISEHGVEFLDNENSRRLRLHGFDFEVSPFFIDRSADPIEQRRQELIANGITDPEEQKSILHRLSQDLEDPRPPQI